MPVTCGAAAFNLALVIGSSVGIITVDSEAPRTIAVSAEIHRSGAPEGATASLMQTAFITAQDRHPQYALVDGDIETLWQRPHGSEVRGIFFAAHGCMHQATDFFADTGADGWQLAGCQSSNFGRCLGLPEERQLFHEARSRGFLVVAVSGGRGVQSCWNMAEDPRRVHRALDYVVRAEGLSAETPILATGASSGGAFMGALATALGSRLRCIVPQISALVDGSEPGVNVPALFVHMPDRDALTGRRVKSNIAALRNRGLRAEEIAIRPTAIGVELTAHYPEAIAKRFLIALRKAGHTDEQGRLKANPRGSSWRQAVREVALSAGDSLVADESPLAELLNVAWAQHEFTAQHSKEMLDFCEVGVDKK